MKKTLFLSGLVSLSVTSLCLLLGWSLYSNDKEEVQISQPAIIPAQQAVYTIDESGNPIELNFTQTAEAVIDGVVHIKSTAMRTNSSFGNPFGDMPDVFRDFFGDGFFGPQSPGGAQPMLGTGSGVIISEDGYVVTNNHVVSQADEIEITLHDNRNYTAEVIGTDPSTDLALLKIDEQNLPVVQLSNSDQVDIGQWVLAVGNPLGLNSTVTAGIISAKGRNINILKDRYAVENFIQTDAAINPGNSGGALVNLNGELVGINTAIASPTGSFSGYGFAIPSNIVAKVIKDLKDYGIVQRGVLGVYIRSVDGDLAKEKDLPFTQGVYIDSLVMNSAAESGGVQSGDVILEVEGIPVKTSSELQGMIARYRPGETVNLLLNREGDMKTVGVTLNNREGNTDLTTKPDKDIMDLLGADLETIDEATAESLDIDGGVVVARLYPGKLSKYTQIQEGFIITKVDGKPVKNLKAFKAAIENREGGVMLEGKYPGVPGKQYFAFGL